MAPSSRASSVIVFLAVALWIALGGRASAHRLDEYLQAARIGIRPDRVHVQLDLTPGTAIAEAVIRSIDRDGDGALSVEEQTAYARRVVSASHLALDGQLLTMTPSTSRLATADALRNGEGTITVDADAALPRLAGGRHQLVFRNGSDADSAVFLANALVPETDRISIGRQTRDADQRQLAIDFAIAGTEAMSTLEAVLITLSGAGILMVPVMRRRRRHRA